jgi:hypothetical protein
MLLGAAIILPLGMLVLTGVGSASALPHGTTNGTGTVTCSVSGKITFKPPLHSSGPVKSEADTARYKMFDCTGGTPDPNSSKTDETEPFIQLAFNTCSALLNENSGTAIEVTWTGNVLNPSTSEFSDSNIEVGELVSSTTVAYGAPNGDTGGTTSTTGSFAGGNQEYLGLYFNESSTQINAACASKKGLKTLTFNPSLSDYGT